MITNDEARGLGRGFRTAHSPLIFWGLGAVCVLALLASVRSATAASPSGELPKITGVRVGLGDCYKPGVWTPVKIMLRGGDEQASGQVAVVVADGDGVPIRIATAEDAPVNLTPDGETTVTLVTRFGRVRGDLTVEFRQDNAVTASRTFSVSSCADGEHFLPAVESQRLVVVVGPASLGAEEICKIQGIESELRPVVARLDDVSELPEQWNAYEGVDAVILSTSQPDIYRDLKEDDARLKTLEQWVRLGGRVVFTVGAQGTKVLGPESALRRFAPGRFEGTKPLRQTQAAALESYCGSASPISRGGAVQTPILAAKVTVADGVVESREADLPLVVRTAWGFGQVIFAAVDLDSPPLNDWADRPRFVAKLLDIPVTRSDDSEENRVIMHYGYNDLAGQMRSALDYYAGVGLVTFSLVAGLIVLYILLIGPGDYFFLNRVVRRMTWTWVTFPLVVVLASVGSFYLAHYLKGDSPRLNQVNLVDVDAKSGLVRGTTWANLFSPRLASYDLSLEPKSLATGGNLFDFEKDAAAVGDQVLLSWFGLPGTALGGMSPRTGNASLWSIPCVSPSPHCLCGMPIQVGATKSLTGRWYASTESVPKVALTEEGGLLAGTVVNTLDFPLEQCLLAHGLSVYELGTIPPKGSFRIDTTTKRSELRTLLTGRKVVAKKVSDQYRPEATPYDQASTDLAYVLRMMMFYNAAGGRHYAGLLNEYQNFVDFSLLLKTDRAILVAATSADAKDPRGGSQLLVDGKELGNSQDKHVTAYRFVFPVKKGKDGQ